MPGQLTANSSMSGKRFDRSSWITLFIGLALLVSGALVTLAAYGVPADGWIVDRGFFGRYTDPVYLTGQPDVNPDLMPGDILVAIDGVPFERLETRAAQLNYSRPDNWEFGETTTYTVERDGSEMEVPVSLQRPPLLTGYKPLILINNLDILLNPFMLIVGLMLFVMRPRQRAAQLIFLFAISIFVVDLMNFGVPAGAADLFSPASYWPRLVLGDLSWFLLIWPFLIHLFLIFPVPKKVVVNHPSVIPIMYGVLISASLSYMVLGILGYDFPGMIYATAITIVALLIVAFCLVHSLLTVKEPVGRMQIRWIIFGSLIGIVGSVIVGLVQEFAIQEDLQLASGFDPTSFWFGLVGLLVSAALPISLAVAVLRYRLWDIEVIINRSLVYGSLTLILGLIYFGGVVLLQGLFRGFAGQDSPLAIVISTLVIAALFSPLRRRVQRFIDRRFYRSKYNAEQILGRFAVSVRDEADLNRLTAELQRAAMSAMQARHVSIWLREADENR